MFPDLLTALGTLADFLNEGGVDKETDLLFSDAAVHKRKFVAFKRTDSEAFESASHLLRKSGRRCETLSWKHREPSSDQIIFCLEFGTLGATIF